MPHWSCKYVSYAPILAFDGEQIDVCGEMLIKQVEADSRISTSKISKEVLSYI